MFFFSQFFFWWGSIVKYRFCLLDHEKAQGELRMWLSPAPTASLFVFCFFFSLGVLGPLLESGFVICRLAVFVLAGSRHHFLLFDFIPLFVKKRKRAVTFFHRINRRFITRQILNKACVAIGRSLSRMLHYPTVRYSFHFAVSSRDTKPARNT